MTDFLDPISEDDPSGESLRYDPIYDEIKEARRSDEADSSMGIWQPVNPKGTDWGRVRKLCEDVLKKRSKDLQIAYWRIEALGHLEHFLGLAEGLEVFANLMEKFWDTVHPQIEEDDYDFRLVPIRNVSSELTTLFYILPITSPSNEQLPIITYFDFLNIKKGESEVPLDQAQRSFLDSDKNWLLEIAKGVKLTIANIKRVEEIAVERCGHHVPSFSSGKNCLSEILNTIKSQVPAIFIEEEEEEEEGEEGEEKKKKKSTADGRSVTIEETRSGAYKLLEEAYRILEKNDPHSPVRVILQHLIAWNTQGLHEISAILEKRGSSIPVLLKTFPQEIEPPK